MNSLGVISNNQPGSGDDGEGKDAPINIKIARQKETKQGAKTRKLLDIIKGYEDEKSKQYLNKDEIQLLDWIEEIKPKKAEPPEEES